MSKFDNWIPQILEVKEIYSNYPESTTFISRDPNAGRVSYSVVRIFHRPGSVLLIGNELPLKHARKIAQQ